MRMETGEFDPPSKVAYTSITKSVIQSPAHQALAEKVAANDLVLLKNDDVTGTSQPLLPADPAKLSNVVIVGNLANTVTLGDYSGDPSLQVNAVQGITAAVQAANPNAQVTYDSCGTSTTATAPADCSAATLAAIKSASLVIVFVGTDLNVATEGHDRTSLAMPGNYDSLISQVNAVGNPDTALVIQSDGPVDLGNVQGDFPAIVFSGYNGESQGTALAQVLFGQQDPAGHLDFTWYADDSQLPPIAELRPHPLPDRRAWPHLHVLHRHADLPVRLRAVLHLVQVLPRPGRPPGGHGQRHGDGQLRRHEHRQDRGRHGRPAVRRAAFHRAGHRAAEANSSRASSGPRTCEPGQTQHITLQVKIPSLSEWDEQALKQVVYDGSYEFFVGPDSATVAGSGTVAVHGAITPRVQYVTVQPDQVVYQAGQTLSLTGTNPWIAPDTDSALEQPHASADNIVEAVNNDESFVNLSRARVTYSSSDPSVASVDSRGLVRAVKDGVATIRVTVNGVTGTAVIVVQGTLTNSTPAVVPAGQPSTVSATLTNGGGSPVSNVALSATVPSGWTATAAGAVTFASVPAGGKATATWQVTPAAGATPQQYPITFAATSSEGTFSSSAQTNVPYASVTAAYDNTGISNDNAPAAGAFDGGGLNFSAQALAADGFVSGQPVTVGGTSFTWPDVNVPDNVVCGGQAVPVSGSGSTLAFLGASNNGTGSGTGTIVYTDGTTQSFALGFADWWSGSAIAGTSIAAATPYLNNGSNSSQQTQTVHVYYASIPIDSSKTVQYVVLPDVTQNGQTAQVTALHVFAIGISG